jgi:hypothetical protein
MTIDQEIMLSLAVAVCLFAAGKFIAVLLP